MVLVCCLEESEHHCMSKGLVKAKCSVKNTRQRPIYDEMVFPLSHPVFFPKDYHTVLISTMA